jgi:hypothetical protein
VAESLLTGTTSYLRGALVDLATTFPEMNLLAQGADAVQALVWQSGTTSFGVWPPVLNPEAVSVATGENCSDQLFDDGTVRCATPHGTGQSSYFSDPACSLPIMPIRSDSPSCVSQEAARWLLEYSSSADQCSKAFSTVGRPVLDAYNGDIYTNASGLGPSVPCMPYDRTTDPNIVGFQTLGDPVDVSSRFAVVTTRVL